MHCLHLAMLVCNDEYVCVPSVRVFIQTHMLKETEISTSIACNAAAAQKKKTPKDKNEKTRRTNDK